MDFTRLNIKGLLGASVISLSDDMTLPEKDRAFVLIVNATAADKTLTLDLPDGACCIVVNVENAFTLKNVSGDAQTPIEARAVKLVVCLEDSDDLLVYALGGSSGETPK